ncbi:MAG: tetratricopeptide repeat protein [Deltaproteobacteria bacterium]|nr:tetratricopeptide repeat protein [Deltaproteobacteria bacterium]
MKKIMALFLLATLFFPTAVQSQNKTVVAVIPFANLMKDSSFDWLSGGIAETLTVKLSNVDALEMVERIRLREITDEMKFAASGLVDEKTAAKVGKLIGAQVLVVGSFQKAGNRLRINGRFVEASTGRIIKTAEATGVTGEIFELQDKIAYGLISTLKIRTTTEEDRKITKIPTESFKAYEYMSRGNDYYVNGNMTEAIRMYKEALAIDRHLGGVKYNLGLAYNVQGNPDRAIEQFVDVLSAKPNDKWSLIMTGNAYKMKGDHQNAILYYQRVLAVFPDDATAHGELGVLYRRLGDREKANAHFSRINYMLKNLTPSTLELDLKKDVFSVRAYNTDDISTVSINGRVAVKTKYAEDSGFVDVMKFLKKGENTIRLTTVNLQIGGWTYGYQIKKNDYVVWEAQDGVCGEWGAQNNDSKTGVVFDKKIMVMAK